MRWKKVASRKTKRAQCLSVVVKSAEACPACAGPIRRFRTEPGRLPRLFRWRLYDCPNCGTIETAEAVTSVGTGKRYVSRVELHDRRPKPRYDQSEPDVA